ncbi:hypothetical protein CUW27_20825 [Salmonella enterica]|nr:hypothetical protein [Salmonella enterica]
MTTRKEFYALLENLRRDGATGFRMDGAILRTNEGHALKISPHPVIAVWLADWLGGPTDVNPATDKIGGGWLPWVILFCVTFWGVLFWLLA